MLFSCSQSEQKTTESEKSVPSFDEVIKTRRSVRSYDSTKTITQEQVKELLTDASEEIRPVLHLSLSSLPTSVVSLASSKATRLMRLVMAGGLMTMV